MTALLSALGSGVGAKKILEFLMRKSPELAPRISNALASGITAEKVLKFFSKDKNFDRLKSSMENEYSMEGNANPLVQAQNVRSQNLGRDLASGAQRAAPGIMAGLGGIGASMALSHALPNLLKGPTQEKIEKNLEIPPQPPITPNVPPNLSQQTQPIQPEIKPINVGEILNKHGLSRHIDELSTKTKDPNAITAMLYNKFPKEMKKFQEEAGKPMEEAIAEYMQSNVKPLDIEQTQQPATQIPSQQENLPPERAEEKPEIEPTKIEKGSTVASPQGIGEVKAIRNGKALIEIDGKKHQVDEDDLIQSPIPEKDLGELFEELQNEIEKSTGEEISKNVEYAAYSPENRELLYKPHVGAFYVYDNISPEIADELVNLLTLRRTTGENHIGVWTKGTKSPIGSRMHDLIKELQSERGGKGKEYRGKYQTIYDALEPAREAKKRLHAERKKEEKRQFLEKSESLFESAEKKEIKPAKEKKLRSQVINEKLGKEYDKLMKLDDIMTQEARSKKIDVEKRKKDLTRLNELQKNVDRLRDELVKQEVIEHEKKAKKPRLD